MELDIHYRIGQDIPYSTGQLTVLHRSTGILEPSAFLLLIQSKCGPLHAVTAPDPEPSDRKGVKSGHESHWSTLTLASIR